MDWLFDIIEDKKKFEKEKEEGKWIKGKSADPLYKNFNVWQWESMPDSIQNKWEFNITGHWDTGSTWKRHPDKRIRIQDNVYEDWYHISGKELDWHPEAVADTSYGWWEGMSGPERKKAFFERRAWENMQKANKSDADEVFKEN